MAKRSRRRRAAPRRRAPAQSASAGPADTSPDGPAELPEAPADTQLGPGSPARGERPRRDRTLAARQDSAIRAPGAIGARPQAPWHPLPLSELLIFVGMIAIVIGFSRRATGVPVLLAGVASVLLGTLEFTIREHLSGYRSHASLLASLPTALAHGAFALLLFALGAPTAALVIVPLALDVPIFTFLFRLLRARFEDARRERVFAGDR